MNITQYYFSYLKIYIFTIRGENIQKHKTYNIKSMHELESIPVDFGRELHNGLIIRQSR